MHFIKITQKSRFIKHKEFSGVLFVFILVFKELHRQPHLNLGFAKRSEDPSWEVLTGNLSMPFRCAARTFSNFCRYRWAVQKTIKPIRDSSLHEIINDPYNQTVESILSTLDESILFSIFFIFKEGIV